MLIEGKLESPLFVVVTLALTGAAWGALALLGWSVEGNAGAFALLALGGLSPTLVALVLPLFAAKGERLAYYRRYFNFKIHVLWYLASILPALLMTLASYAAVVLFFKSDAAAMKIQQLYMILPFFFMEVVGGGLEEIGWRGLLVHNLRNANPVAVSLGVGLVWAVWHVPLFFIKGVTQYHNYFIPFLMFVVAASFVMSALFLRTGSAVPCVLAHTWINVSVGLGFWYCGNERLGYLAGAMTAVVAIVFFAAVVRKRRATIRPDAEKIVEHGR